MKDSSIRFRELLRLIVGERYITSFIPQKKKKHLASLQSPSVLKQPNITKIYISIPLMLNKKQLLEQLLQMKHPQKLLEKLVVIRALLLKYGKKLTLPRFLEGIKNGDADTASMIHLLEQAKLLHLPKLSVFIREFQEKLPREHLQFRLESNDEDIIAPLTAYLEEKFGKVEVAFHPLASENLTVKMKGQGYIFKRSLEKDLEVLLE